LEVREGEKGKGGTFEQSDWRGSGWWLEGRPVRYDVDAGSVLGLVVDHFCCCGTGGEVFIEGVGFIGREMEGGSDWGGGFESWWVENGREKGEYSQIPF
jgi:hypothetical protein